MVNVKNIVVIGVGLMGNGIAQISLMAGYNTTLVDISQEVIDKAVAGIDGGLKKLETKGVLNAAETIARMKTSLDLASAVKDADLIIEAVVEDMDVKKKLFKICDENAPSHAVIASNTSTMSITEMASATKREDICIGIHFFNPAPLMRLVEVIAGEKSSEEAMETGMKVSESLPCLRGDRFVAKVLKDRPGFIVNRLNAPGGIYMNYLLDTCLEKGIPFESLDADLEVVVQCLHLFFQTILVLIQDIMYATIMQIRYMKISDQEKLSLKCLKKENMVENQDKVSMIGLKDDHNLTSLKLKKRV